jgi:RNA-binding protein
MSPQDSSISPTHSDPQFDVEPPSKALIRQLKARAQKLEPVLKVGQAGVSPSFLQSLNIALTLHQLVKVRFSSFKEEKESLIQAMTQASHSHVIARVGHVVVLYRANS